MALTLKNYQEKSLAAIDAFLSAARQARNHSDMQSAFDAGRAAGFGESAPRGAYRLLDASLPTVAVACIRIPTGGGKTLLAAHAVEHAARIYADTTTPVVLWLVPTKVIQEQTVNALKQPGHDYREALLAHYPADRLTVIDISECEQLRAQDFGGRAIVIVATMQTLRVDNTASRDVYAYKENFEPHFRLIDDDEFLERVSQADIDRHEHTPLKASDIGKVKRSLANLLAWYRPIVIVDEAHNAQTDLSLEVMRRIRPACVIEWTATPAPDQNVLYHVSAQALKAENMIKLPIVLSPHPNWHEAVRDAILTRNKLAEAARDEDDYVRPIVLLQADASNGEVPVEKLTQHLQEVHDIDPARIAIATGKQRGLDGVNLFQRTCPIEFVITVEALKEGWDCSFAYVFCTVQRVRSSKDMEQLLGRVLRLPYAKPRKNAKLSRAYAHVSAPVTVQVASELTDKLVAMGFEEIEAAAAVTLPALGDMFAENPVEPLTIATTLTVNAKTLEWLQSAAPELVAIESLDAGEVVTLKGEVPVTLLERIAEIKNTGERTALLNTLTRHQARVQVASAPSQRNEQMLPIPQLCVELQGELLLLEPELLGEISDFSLANQPSELPAFAKQSDEKAYLIDIERGKLRFEQERQDSLIDIDSATEGVRREDVLRELDRRIRRSDLIQADKIAWLGKVLDGLEKRGISLVYCARHVSRLADTIALRLEVLLQQGKLAAFRQTLFGDSATPAVNERFAFSFKPESYPASRLYNGPYRFKKHFYPAPGDLADDIATEETACAVALDSMDEVRVWVRNLDSQPVTSFWLPTSNYRFYPDFVAELVDGRMLVVEYKGAHLLNDPKTVEKRDVGEVWARSSQKRCVFVMPTDEVSAGKSVTDQIGKALKQK